MICSEKPYKTFRAFLTDSHRALCYRPIVRVKPWMGMGDFSKAEEEDEGRLRNDPVFLRPNPKAETGK
jgi:hypothetical protein